MYGVPFSTAHAIGQQFANANGHDHTGMWIEGINGPSVTHPDVPPKEGPVLPSDDRYSKYRTSQT